MIKIAFITDEFWDGNIREKVPCIWEQTLIGSLRSLNIADIQTAYYGSDFDISNADIVFVTDHYGRTDFEVDYSKINGPKIVRVWAEISAVQRAEKHWHLYNNVDLHLYMGGSVNVPPVFDKSKLLTMWGPVDDSLCFADRTKIKFAISFVGTSSQSPWRMNYLTLLAKLPFRLYCGDSVLSKYLDIKEYLELMRQSRISISISEDAYGKKHLKGRTFDVTANGACLFANDREYTGEFFEEGFEYVYFKDGPDLCRKIRYYLGHLDELERIAENGHKRFVNCYTGRHWWNKVLAACGFTI